MGKTSQPLVIWVAPAWKDHPKINELREKGHNVIDMSVAVAGPYAEPDLILHPNAWRWDDEKWDFIEIAVKEARKGQPTPANNAKAGAKPRRGKGLKSAA